MLRDSAARYLAERHDLAAQRGAIGRVRAVDRAQWSQLAELGWLGLSLPEWMAGSGLSLAAEALLAEQFGRAAFGAPYIAASVMPTALLAQASDSPLATELAAGLQSGETLLTLAWQERAGQFDAEVPATTLVDGRIHGSKCFVPVADSADVLLVSVQAGAELALVAVAADAAGIRYEHQAGGSGTVSSIIFTQTSIIGGAPLLIGAQAVAAMQSALAAGRVTLAAYLQGLAAGLLDKTLAYVKVRSQFGRAIASFQTIQHRCVDLYIGVQMAGASWRHALKQIESGAEGEAAIVAAVCAAKARCSDVAREVGRESVQMHGAIGFTAEVDVGVYLRAALHGYGWLGAPVQHRRQLLQLAAPQLESFHV